MRTDPKTLVVLSITLLGTLGCAAVQPKAGVPQCILQSTSLTPQTNGLGALTQVNFVAPSDADAQFRPTRCCARLAPATPRTMCTANGTGGTTFTLAKGTSQVVSRSVVMLWKNVDQVQIVASRYNPIEVAFQCTVPVIISGVARTCSYAGEAAFMRSSLPSPLNESTSPACCALLDVPPGPELARAPGAEPWWRAEPPTAAASSAPSPLPDPGTLTRLDATWR